MCLLWTIIIVISVYGWIVVYSLYIELSDLTRLEDLAHLRVSIRLFFFKKFSINNSCKVKSLITNSTRSEEYAVCIDFILINVGHFYDASACY